MARPAAIARALERAASVAWVAGKEARAKHIKALETQARELDEDHREQCAKHEAVCRRIQHETDCLVIGMQLNFMAAFSGATQAKEQ